MADATPTAASAAYSVINCRSNCPREAPSAVRMAISLRRASFTASRRFATFAQAIISTHPAMLSTMMPITFNPLSVFACQSALKLRPPFACGYFACKSALRPCNCALA